MLAGIQVVCFFTSYLIALVLEISRLFFRMPVRLIAILGFAAMGLGLQAIYLSHRASTVSLPLSSWHDWYLIASLLLAAFYWGLLTIRPQTNIGLFILPVVLILIGVAWNFPGDRHFPRDQALQMWGVAHGLMLLLGTVAISIGFVAGLMYLVQSWRLKHHVAVRSGLRLPSLELLQTVNRWSLVGSSCFIALGLVAGIVLNVVRSRGRGPALPWTDSIVISSAILLVWLVAAAIFEWLYKPAQQGRKVAYLTVASFFFLAVVTTMVLAGSSQHARPQGQESGVGRRESGIGSRESEVGGVARSAAIRNGSLLDTQYSVPSTQHSVLTAFTPPAIRLPTVAPRLATPDSQPPLIGRGPPTPTHAEVAA